MLFRIILTTLLQISCEIFQNSQVIIKSIIDPDENSVKTPSWVSLFGHLGILSHLLAHVEDASAWLVVDVHDTEYGIAQHAGPVGLGHVFRCAVRQALQHGGVEGAHVAAQYPGQASQR